MHLESPKITLEKSAQEVYEFLAQLSNFESLMPENTDK